MPDLLCDSSIALVLTNISTINDPKSVLTTKFFYYIRAERLVLHVRSDVWILKDTIKKANISIATRNTGDEYDFILERWKEGILKLYATMKVDQNFKRQFSKK